jgi:diaminohydroxyphosphoribosylaminopyrimidine deaminase / 5-amino-6-(5-phosphoribosylamino)uracil reductase
MNGRGRVEPNPMVGCVIVKDGRVIGEGHTQPPGGPHAEPTALANCTESPASATAYVTLEPCCHTNKRTPPCAPRLVEAKIARVVYGCLDPNPPVNGNGVAMLRAAGIRVDGPVLEAAAKQLIAPFIARVLHQRPYVTLKWAQTADKRVAGPGGKPLSISNSASQTLVHRLRSRCDSIAVGINTVLQDNPQLTVRGIEGSRNPARFVLDSHFRTPGDARVLQGSEAETTIFHGYANAAKARHRQNGLEIIGATLMLARVGPDGRLSLPDVLRKIYDRAGYDLLVEPGPTLASSFFGEDVADRLWVFRSPMRVDDDSAPQAADIPANWIETGALDLAGDTLTEYLNPASPVFFAAEASADFVLASESNRGQ